MLQPNTTAATAAATGAQCSMSEEKTSGAPNNNNNNNTNNNLGRGTIRSHQRVDTLWTAGHFSLHGRNSISSHVEDTTHTLLSRPDAVRPPSPLTGGIQVQNMAYDIHRHELLIRSVNYFPMFGYPPCPFEIAYTNHSSFATG